MNLTKSFCFAAIAAIALFSCKKEASNPTAEADTTTPIGVSADYSGKINENRVDLAKSLVAMFAANPEIQAQTVSACNEKFDGDRNVLCSNLFAQSVSSNAVLKTNGESTFGALLNEAASKIGGISYKSANDFASSVIVTDSLIQLYLFVGNNSGDSTSFDGIVIRPEILEENNPVDLLVINKDGSETTIRSDVDPTKNYLVVSRNERSKNVSVTVTDTVNLLSLKTASLKYLKIKSAKFASVDALRKVEGWWDGDAEVRLDVLYNVGSEIKNCSAPYSGFWLGGNWFKQTVVWNTQSITLPTWDNATQGERKFIWNEADGAKAEHIEVITYVDPKTGLSMTKTKTTPASTGDALIGSTYRAFSDPLGYIDLAGFTFEIQYQ